MKHDNTKVLTCFKTRSSIRTQHDSFKSTSPVKFDTREPCSSSSDKAEHGPESSSITGAAITT